MTITISGSPIEAAVSAPMWEQAHTEPQPPAQRCGSAASTHRSLAVGRALFQRHPRRTLLVFLFCGGISLLADLTRSRERSR